MSVPITEEEAIRSWRGSGIPYRYTNPAHSFSFYAGQPGPLQARSQAAVAAFGNPDFRKAVKQDRKGYLMVDDDEECFALLARTVSINLTVPLIYTDLAHINQPRNTGLFESCRTDIKALFVRGFFQSHYPAAWSDTERVTMEMNFRWIIDRGVALFLLSEAPMDQISWWSPSLLKLISKTSLPNTLLCLT